MTIPLPLLLNRLFWYLIYACHESIIIWWQFLSFFILVYRNFLQLSFSADNTGRVLKYNQKTKETTVLLRNIQFPNGLSLSKDRSFFVYCEGLMERCVSHLVVEVYGRKFVAQISDPVHSNFSQCMWINLTKFSPLTFSYQPNSVQDVHDALTLWIFHQTSPFYISGQ